MLSPEHIRLKKKRERNNVFLLFTGILGLLAAIYGICGGWWMVGTIAICLIFLATLNHQDI